MERSAIEALLTEPTREIVAIHRRTPEAGIIQCRIELMHDPSQDDLEDAFPRWGALPGELHLFDAEILWVDQKAREQSSTPPERWQARHGRYLVDGFLPDDQGRVVCGGPY